MQNTNTSIQTKDLGIVAVATGLILLIPLVAMQFSREVSWTHFDFVIAGILLFGTGLILSLIVRRVSNMTYKVALIGLAILGFLYIWAELAVGIFFNFGS